MLTVLIVSQILSWMVILGLGSRCWHWRAKSACCMSGGARGRAADRQRSGGR